jgi:hypothetical protein
MSVWQKRFLHAIDKDMTGMEIMKQLRNLGPDEVDAALVYENKKYKEENNVNDTVAEEMLKMRRHVISEIQLHCKIEH